MTTDAAADLTEHMKHALVTAPSTPLGNVWLTCAGSTKDALVRRGLAEGWGDWCTLTERGKAIRAQLCAPSS